MKQDMEKETHMSKRDALSVALKVIGVCTVLAGLATAVFCTTQHLIARDRDPSLLADASVFEMIYGRRAWILTRLILAAGEIGVGVVLCLPSDPVTRLLLGRETAEDS